MDHTLPLAVHLAANGRARTWLSRALAQALCVLATLLALPTHATDVPRDYLIGAGDVLRVAVYQSPDLTMETRVTEGGTISYPLLGAVRVGGLSASQAETEIARGLREGQFVKQPQVTVLVMQVRAHQVSVLGLVNRPGRYPIETVGMRLTELLAQAGGVTPGGSDLVSVSGQRNGKPYRVEVDLPALLTGAAQATDPVLAHGDVVFIDRMPTIYIYGEVQRPGTLRLERGMSVMQALAAGGGVTLRGTERGLKVHRRKADGALDVFEATMTDRLQDGDVIHVRESLF
jgi:polysaccharide biosynthesis/export protein